MKLIYRLIALHLLLAVYCGTSDAKRPSPICYQQKRPGICETYLVRYYYNSRKDICEKFFFKGCRASANGFRTYRKCEEACLD